MKQLKWLIGMFFMIGMPFPLFFPDTHQWYFGFIGLLSAFIGSGITYGFGGYRTHPKHFGDLNENPKPPVINQVWMMFFVSAVVNLFWATTYIN